MRGALNWAGFFNAQKMFAVKLFSESQVEELEIIATSNSETFVVTIKHDYGTLETTMVADSSLEDFIFLLQSMKKALDNQDARNKEEA